MKYFGHCVRPVLLSTLSTLSLAATAVPVIAAEDATSQAEEIVITGSRIRSPNLTSSAPITSVTGADIAAQGAARVEDLLNTLPQTFGAQGAGVSNRSNGTATVNLRGLGAARTLVLIDGRRLMSGNPTSQISPVAADLNFIPSALVERVDVLTGGASAVYGADAVAGVVNFIMNRDFEGLRVDAQHSFYQHSQGNEEVQGILRAARAAAVVPETFPIPDDFSGGESTQVSLTFGVNSPDQKGNITAYATYLTIDAVEADSFDYTACSLNSGASFAAAGCGGSGTAFPARIDPLDPDGAGPRPDPGNFIVDPAGPGNTFRTRRATDLYNFTPLNYMQRPDTRYGLGAFARYEIAPIAEAYMDVMHMSDKSVALIAPGGISPGAGPGPGGTYQINCNNPLLTPTQQTQLCGVDAGTPRLINALIARRNLEGGGRPTTFDHEAQRYVVGLRGDISTDWNYDTYLQYGRTTLNQRVDNYFVTSRVNKALLATTNAAGQIVCQDASDGCVPYNPFRIGGVTQEQLDYLQAPSFSGGDITQKVASASLVGKLPESFKSPWAEERIGVSLGAEYRREKLGFEADLIQRTGQLNGGEGAIQSVDGSFDVTEGFAELRLPLLQDIPLVKDLTLELAYRYSDYSTGFSTDAYKLSGDWAVSDGVRVRAGYNRAARGPNVVELFTPKTVVLAGSVDPCAGLQASNPLVARCAMLFNLTPAQVLTIEPDPANQYKSQTGGNPDLEAEVADTYTVGVVLSPTFAPGLNVTLDYYDITVDGFISGIGANNIQNGCITGNTPSFCALIKRDALGSLRSADGFVIDIIRNTGKLHTSGIDVALNYRTTLDRLGLENFGSASLSFVGTRLNKLETTSIEGGTTIDCAGLYGAICSTLGGSNNPNPEWRHKARLTWDTPLELGAFNDFSISAQWRYIDSVALDRTSSQVGLGGATPGGPATDLKLGSRSYIDLLLSFAVKDDYRFRFGINNVFDKDPPIAGGTNCPTGPCNANIYSQVYDSLGRYIFFGFQAEF